MYTFRFNPVDNDAELTIDGVKVIDHWCATYLQGSKYLTKGVHDIQVWYFQGTPYAAALTLQWMGPDLPWETIPLRFGVTTLDVLAETSPGEPSPLPWDGLVSTTLIVEARGTGSYPPQSLTARVTSLRNDKVTLLELDKVSQQGNEAVFRGVSPASGIVDPAGPGSVAIVDYAGSEDEYNLALDFLDLLAVPDYLRMGIAWGEGREPDRPPATLAYLRAAGYERAMLDVVGYAVTPRYFFVQNQAETLLYMGHGHHKSGNVLVRKGLEIREAGPGDIGASWNKGLQTVILFACSVLDIGDMNCWWYRKGGDRARTDPGLKWLENVPGPSTWLGFQEKAPVLFAPGEDGEDIVCALAYQHGWGGYSWIDAWRLATHKNQWLESPGSATPEDPPQSGCQTNPRHNAVAAVAIGGESDGRMYYYWHEECGWFFCSYTWRELPEVQWEEPCICLHQEPVGLEVWVIPPVEVHIYNGVGQHVGPGAEGIETGIPQSSYGFGIAILRSGEEVTPLHVSIEGADLGGVYRLRLASVVDGPFDLFIEIPDRSMGVFYRVSYLAVPGRAGTEYFLPLEPGADFGLMVDGDGDGVFEGRWAPSALETYTAPGAP